MEEQFFVVLTRLRLGLKAEDVTIPPCFANTGDHWLHRVASAATNHSFTGIPWPAICDIWLGKRTVPVLAVAKEVAALQRGRDRDLGELRTDRRRTAEKLFFWSFVCRLFGCFSSLLEVIIGQGCLLSVQS